MKFSPLFPSLLVLTLIASGCVQQGPTSNEYKPSEITRQPSFFEGKSVKIYGYVNFFIACGTASGAVWGTQMISDYHSNLNLAHNETLVSESLFLLDRSGHRVRCYTPPFSNKGLECNSSLYLTPEGSGTGNEAIIVGEIVRTVDDENSLCRPSLGDEAVIAENELGIVVEQVIQSNQ